MSKKKFPKKFVVMGNKEKKDHEKWTPERDELNIPGPFRMILAGGVNSGKTLTIKNILVRINPIFKNIYLLHCGGKFTTEYDEIEYELLEEVPTADDERFNGKEKSLIIIEDKCFENVTRDQKKAYNRLFGYMSTHRNLSIMMTAQNYTDIPASLRRMANFVILWKVTDTDLLKTIGRRVGLDKNTMVELSQTQYDKYTDSLWFDRTPHTPFPLRRNGYELIDLKNLV